jgi:hypothetical protein
MPSIVSAARLAIVLAWLPLPSHLLAQSSAVPTGGILGFYERCSQRSIVCFSEKELSAGKSDQLSGILVRAGGLHRQCNGSVYKCALSMKPSSGVEECTPSYYLNGVAFFRAFPDEALPELEKFVRPIDVRGIEVYRSEQRPPAPFNSPTSCGVILIWTKQ